MNALGPFVVAGMVIGAGALLIIMGALRSPVRLADALAVLDGSVPETRETHPERKGLEALGDWLHGTLRLPLTRNQQRLLLLSGRSIADFFAEKLVLATTGLFLPAIWLVVQVVLGNPTTPVPLLLGPVLGVGGYFLADLRLARTSRQVSRSTSEAIHTFFDLVALERLANASATQAVTQAATISDAPLFRRMAAGLERCRLEQTTPWRELHRIADEWNVPELSDFADIMRLEEQGAALAETLQARVRELREGHLAQQRSRAQEDTEALTIWMTLPALILGLGFIIPPLFILVGL
jgi:type II secretion system F domain protein